MIDLKQIANESEVTKALFKHFSSRQRYRKSSNIPYIQMVLRAEGQEFDQKQLIEAFKILSAANLGIIVHGRGKSPTRFVWNYNLKDIAKVAEGKKTMDQAQVIKIERSKRQVKTREVLSPIQQLVTQPGLDRETVAAALAQILAYFPK